MPGQKIRRKKEGFNLVGFPSQELQDLLGRIDDKASLLISKRFASGERPHTFGNRLRNACVDGTIQF